MSSIAKTLSIVIPCYNAEKYIERCLSSLDGLNSSIIDIIIVNDGSTDRSLSIVLKWANGRTNVNVVSKENGGYCSAINRGLDLCKSSYVMFLGADDEIISSSLNNICFYLDKNSPDILAFSTLIKNDNDSKDLYNQRIDPLTRYPHPGFFEQSVGYLCKKEKKNSHILFTRDTSRCFKMSTIGSTRYFGKIGVSSDGCFSSLIALRANSFEFVNELCYVWHLRSDSVSGKKKTLARTIDEAEVWKAFFEKIREYENIDLPSTIVNRVWIYKRVAERLIEANQLELAKYHLSNVEYNIKWLSSRKDLPLKTRFTLKHQKLYVQTLKILKKW